MLTRKFSSPNQYFKTTIRNNLILHKRLEKHVLYALLVVIKGVTLYPKKNGISAKKKKASCLQNYKAVSRPKDSVEVAIKKCR